MDAQTTAESTATQPAVRFDKIGQIAVTVRDLTRSKHFYQHVLGMKPLFDAGNMAFFQCGDIRFAIGLAEEQTAIGGTILYFMVEDIQGTNTALKERSVEIVQEPHLVARMPDHDLWIAFVKDPDGNVLGMMSEVRHA